MNKLAKNIIKNILRFVWLKIVKSISLFVNNVIYPFTNILKPKSPKSRIFVPNLKKLGNPKILSLMDTLRDQDSFIKILKKNSINSSMRIKEPLKTY